MGAVVHLAEPAETAARRGNKKRAKSDRADARHLRELVMVGRLPESWIAPEHILDLRARVRLRHTLVCAARRVAAAHPGGALSPRLPAAAQPDDRRGAALACRAAAAGGAREQVTVALAMIDALDAQLAPLTRELRAYARRQPGCRALMAPLRDRGADGGDDPRRARRRGPVLLLARGRPLRRDGHHRAPVRPAPRPRPPVAARGRRRCAGRCSRPRSPRPAPAAPTATTTARRPSGWAPIARACRSRASCSSAATTRCASSARRRCNPREFGRCARSPHSHRCAAAGSSHAPAATPAWTALIDRAAATLPPAGSLPCTPASC